MKIFAILNNKEKISIKGLNAIIGKQKEEKNCLGTFIGEKLSTMFILKTVQKLQLKILKNEYL